MIDCNSNVETCNSSGSIEARIRREVAAMLGEPELQLDPDKPLADLGIDSLYRLELETRLETAFGVALDSKQIPANLTLNDVVNEITHALRASGVRSISGSERESEPGLRVPLTPSQLEFLENCDDKFEKHAIVLTLRTPSDLNIEALMAACRSLERHDALRLRFRRIGVDWIQEYGMPGTSIEFRTVDAREADDQQARMLGSRFFSATAGNFNLAEGPVVRAELLDRGPGSSSILLLSIHHLVADGTSIPLLLADLERQYQNHIAATPEAMTYAAWANRLQHLAQSDEIVRDLSYWQQVGDVARTMEADDGRVETTSVLYLSSEESREFTERYATSQAQHDALLTALARSWTQLSGQRSPCVLMESHGRAPLQGPEPLRTVGRFACHFPLRIEGHDDIRDHSEPRHLIESVPNFGLSFGLLKYVCCDLRIRQAMQAIPAPTIAMAYQGRWNDFFRADCQFPVIARHVFNETLPKPASRTGLTLVAGMEKRRVWAYLAFRPKQFSAEFANRALFKVRANVTAN